MLKSMRAFPVVLVLVCGYLLLFTYQNCSKVAFSYDTASLAKELNDQSGILINGNDPYTQSQDVVINVFYSESDQMYVTDDPTCDSGGQWEPFSPTKAWKLSAKNKDVRVYAKFRKSSVKQVESECRSDSIIHDDIAPNVSLAQSIPPYTNKSTVDANFSATDSGSGVASVACGDDANPTATVCQSGFSKGGLGEGQHIYRAVATDKAGNVSNPFEVSFIVDQTAPVVVLNSVPPKITSLNAHIISFSGVDQASGIERFECKGPGQSAFAACSSPFSVSSNIPSQVFEVRAYDRAGNVSAPLSYDWQFDPTVSGVKITSAPAAQTNQDVGAFTFVSLANASPIVSFECSLDGGGYSGCSSPYTTPKLTEGSHTFSVRGLSATGSSSSPDSYTWFVDLTAPVVQITSQPKQYTNQTSGQIFFTANDAQTGIKSVECSIDSKAFVDCKNSSYAFSQLLDGAHSVVVRAIDNAGNKKEVTASWNVDTVKPEITSLTGPANPTTAGDATLNFVAVDPGSAVAPATECKINDEISFGSCTSPMKYMGLLDGVQTFFVRAVDLAGNVSDVRTYTWLIDRLGPAINISKAPSSPMNMLTESDLKFAVTDAGSGVKSVMCTFQNQADACDVMTSKHFAQLPVGDYSYYIEAIDNLGNKSTQTVTWKVVDTSVMHQRMVMPSNKLDVLVVIDNSGSMALEQQSMSTRFNSFLQKLQGLDWRVGIVTTEAGTSTKTRTYIRDGQLVAFDENNDGKLNEKVYSIDSTMAAATASSYFAEAIQREEQGSGDEQGIRAAYRAIERSKDLASTWNPNRAFFRSDAALAIVVVTDADETNPDGTQTFNKPDELVKLVNSTWQGRKALAFHSIIVKPGDQVCKDEVIWGGTKENPIKYTNEGYGESYNSASELTGGIVGSVCSMDYTSQLAAMGDDSRALLRSATLDCAPLDKNFDGKPDITLSTASGPVNANYMVSGLTVTFDQAMLANVQYTVQYHCAE